MVSRPDIPELDQSALSGVKPTRTSGRGQRIATVLLVPLALALVVVTLVFYVFYTATQVDGESMLPNLRPSDRVLITKSYGAPVRGDVVVAHILEQDGQIHDVIKRVVAVSGDTVEVRDDVAYINGRQESFASIHRAPGVGVDVQEFTLGPGEVYLLGDNRPISYDSRYIGPVPEDDIQGKAVAIFTPLTRMRTVQ